jgi:hypothetical protein
MTESKSNSSPVFIGGLYRSGTSLLRAMLGRHSNLAAGLETFWFDLDFTGRSSKRENVRNWDGTRNEPLEDHLARLAGFFDIDREAVFGIARSARSAEEFIDRFMSRYASNVGKNRWVEKTPANVLHVERIFSYWPKGFFIHVVRDPRDVYSSVRRTGKWEEPEEFARLWIQFMSAYLDVCEGRFSGSIFEVSYERLILDPAGTMQELVEFICERPEPGLTAFPGEPDDFEKVRRITGKSSTTLEQLSRPLAGNRIGAWKKEIDDPAALFEIERIIEKAGYRAVWEGYKTGG